MVAVEKEAPTSATEGSPHFSRIFPAALGGREVAALLGEFDNVAEGVLGARIGGVHVRRLALGIVGEHHIDLAVSGIRLDILRPVHRRGLKQVAGAARLDQHVGLAFEAIGGRQRTLAVHQRQPFERAVLREFGDIQRALVEQVHVGGAVFGVEGPGGDEFVDIVEALVVAEIEDDAAILGDDRTRRPHA